MKINYSYLKKRLFGWLRKLTTSSLEDDFQYDKPEPLKCFVAYNQYGGYCLPVSSLHRSAPKRILRGDIYEPGTLSYILQHSGDGDIVHAGTYFGDFLPALSRGVGPEFKVWAFEPNPENFHCAQITVLINKLENVELNNMGLAARNGTSLMRVTDDKGVACGGKSTVIEGQVQDVAAGVSVQLVRLDDVIPKDRHISILHLDVEGHEELALEGALETIKRCHPILILETRDGSALLESEVFTDHLTGLGYEKTGYIHRNTILQVRTPSISV